MSILLTDLNCDFLEPLTTINLHLIPINSSIRLLTIELVVVASTLHCCFALGFDAELAAQVQVRPRLDRFAIITYCYYAAAGSIPLNAATCRSDSAHQESLPHPDRNRPLHPDWLRRQHATYLAITVPRIDLTCPFAHLDITNHHYRTPIPSRKVATCYSLASLDALPSSSRFLRDHVESHLKSARYLSEEEVSYHPSVWLPPTAFAAVTDATTVRRGPFTGWVVCSESSDHCSRLSDLMISLAIWLVAAAVPKFALGSFDD